MKQKCLKLSEKALISRLWAQYNKLPQAFKKVFFNITQNLALEAGKQKQVIQ
jgi:hypothetical protein